MAFSKADHLDFFIKFRVVWEEVEDYKEQIIIELNCSEKISILSDCSYGISEKKKISENAEKSQ